MLQNLSNSFIFIFLFFFGLDNFILFQRTFSQPEYYNNTNYIHYFLSNIAVWLSGFIFFKKMVLKYNINRMILFSLLISSFTSWAQYRIGQQSLGESFNSNIVINLLFNFNMSFLTTTVAHYIKLQSSIEDFRKKIVYSVSCVLLGFVVYPIFTQNTLGDYFIMTSVLYIIGFFLWPIISTNEPIKIQKIALSFLIAISIVMASSLLMYYMGHKEIKNTFDNLTIIFLFLFMIIFMKIINRFKFKEVQAN